MTYENTQWRKGKDDLETIWAIMGNWVGKPWQGMGGRQTLNLTTVCLTYENTQWRKGNDDLETFWAIMGNWVGKAWQGKASAGSQSKPGWPSEFEFVKCVNLHEIINAKLI